MRIGNREFDTENGVYVMGILNVTPDSFSDGGRWLERDAALRQAAKMAAEGAAIIDIGGESTRPGHTPVSAEDEAARVLHECGVETELIDIGLDVPGCRACGACSKLGRCVIDDGVNAFAEKMRSADGLIVGSPVY